MPSPRTATAADIDAILGFNPASTTALASETARAEAAEAQAITFNITSLQPVSNRYTSSGAIAITDALCLFNSASALAMTLASNVADGHRMTFKNIGAGLVTITVSVLDTLASGTITLVTGGSAQITWDQGEGTYLLLSAASGGGSAPITTASSLVLWTPAQTTPFAQFVLQGTFLGGPPLSLDYSTNGGTNWTTATGAQTVINNATQAYAITVSAGVAAASYPAGQLLVRDTNAHSVTAQCGTWTVSTQSLTTAPGSATALIFAFQSANPNALGFDSGGNVNTLKDLGGSGRYLTIGPTTPNNVLGGTRAGPASLLKPRTGSDSTRTTVGLTETTNPAIYDIGANFFDAGPVGGPNDALIQMMNCSSLSATTGAGSSWTVTFATYIDTTAPGGYCGGPIWGAWFSSGAVVSYASACRWHSGGLAAQINDLPNSVFYGPSVSVSSSAWAVLSVQKSGTTFQWRMNKGTWNSATISATTGLTFTNMSWGGSFTENIGSKQSGNGYPRIGDFFIFTGALNSTDLGNFETAAGNSIGLTI